MKPFNLQEAIAGNPIQTRDGRMLKLVAYVPEAREGYEVIVMKGDGYIGCWREDGTYLEDEEDDGDIVMAPVTKTVYANVFKGKYSGVVHTSSETFNSVAEAVDDACYRNYTYIKTIEIKIEG